MRRTSTKGIDLIKSFEGCRLTSYKAVPTETIWTIGWGHYGVNAGMTITQAQADALLVSDLIKYENYVNNTTYCPVAAGLNQSQFDALVSFCYNCGPGNLKKLCGNRSIEEIGNAITLFDKSGGRTLPGLTRRRVAEQKLFFNESSNQETIADTSPENFPIIKKGATGFYVEVAQTALNYKGARPILEVTKVFDAITENAVIQFQATHTDKNGNPLKKDGILGPKSWWALMRV